MRANLIHTYPPPPLLVSVSSALQPAKSDLSIMSSSVNHRRLRADNRSRGGKYLPRTWASSQPTPQTSDQ